MLHGAEIIPDQEEEQDLIYLLIDREFMKQTRGDVYSSRNKQERLIGGCQRRELHNFLYRNHLSSCSQRI